MGSPEKPLSDLGQLSFRSYWTEVLLDALLLSHCDYLLKAASSVAEFAIWVRSPRWPTGSGPPRCTPQSTCRS